MPVAKPNVRSRTIGRTGLHTKRLPVQPTRRGAQVRGASPRELSILTQKNKLFDLKKQPFTGAKELTVDEKKRFLQDLHDFKARDRFRQATQKVRQYGQSIKRLADFKIYNFSALEALLYAISSKKVSVAELNKIYPKSEVEEAITFLTKKL